MTTVLSYKAKQAIDHWLRKFPPDQKQSAVLYALKVVQAENQGWLSAELMDAVAAYLGMPNIAVYEVASFYTMFDLKPVGKHKICVCTNVSCLLRGSEKVLEHLKNRLGINPGETTSDGRFSLRAVECLAACGTAPVMQIGRVYHENLTLEKIEAVLSGLESENGQ